MTDLQHPDYLRQRIAPRCGDPLYLHLSDLLLGLSRHASTSAPVALLDYGCGGSPYRSLFPQARYLRADMRGAAGVDYEIAPDGSIGAEPGSFDLVLSTQVLEHIPAAASYLRSCYELLRPGGTLVLTTHGIFEDHSCPDDYRRWTADGLAADIAAAGFDAVSVKKLTTQGRALAMLMRTKLHLLTGGRRDGFGILFRLVNRILVRMSREFDRWCDARLDGFRCVDAAEAGHAIYIGLLATARRPAGKS